MKEYLESLLNQKIESIHKEQVQGGSINQVYKLTINGGLNLCCKINDAAKYPGMFEKEKAGLDLLRSKAITRVPEVLGVTSIHTNQLLVMEWIEQGRQSTDFWRIFGEAIAALHGVRGDAFGLEYNNYMGALPQSNSRAASWVEFFMNERIDPQVKMAMDNGKLDLSLARKFHRLSEQVRSLFPENEPSLVHGDLWSGNFLCDADGRPVLIDPAVYFGHPAVDLGLTTLFGGFERSFYDAYHYHRPADGNHLLQWELCNLYPLLIHLNLFGRSYLAAIRETLDRFD